MDILLEKTLEALGYPVRLQGSYKPHEAYPDHFFTYWNDSADGKSFYSNKENAVVWQYSLNFYSVDPELVSNIFTVIEDKPTAKSLLLSEGWIVSGAGHSVVSDEPTHTGRGITVLFRQTQ